MIHNELVLFYRVKDLQPYDFRKTVLANDGTQETPTQQTTTSGRQPQSLVGTQMSDESSTMNDESKTS